MGKITRDAISEYLLQKPKLAEDVLLFLHDDSTFEAEVVFTDFTSFIPKKSLQSWSGFFKKSVCMLRYISNIGVLS